MDTTVLLVGFGMQGQAVLHDLAASGEVSRIVVADSRADLASRLSRYPSAKVTGRKVDAEDESALAALMREADIVIEALPGTFAFRMGRLAAECGVPLVSSMYFTAPDEELQALDRKAKEKGIVLLSEFGLDPGLDLILARRAIGELDIVREFYSYGAGLPDTGARANPLQYKFSWSVMGVMRSYRRPARIVSHGEVRHIAAEEIFEARHCHTLDVAGIGALECFPNGDSVRYAALLGIRDSVQELGRYTCRYPGHCAFWDVAVKSGFLDGEAMAFTASLLASQQQFQYAAGERDLTLIRVDARGTRQGKRTQVVYELIDRRDLETGLTSMQRTVGFTISLGARLILSGKLATPGLLLPMDVPYESVLPALESHGIRVHTSTS